MRASLLGARAAPQTGKVGQSRSLLTGAEHAARSIGIASGLAEVLRVRGEMAASEGADDAAALLAESAELSISRR